MSDKGSHTDSLYVQNWVRQDVSKEDIRAKFVLDSLMAVWGPNLMKVQDVSV